MTSNAQSTKDSSGVQSLARGLSLLRFLGESTEGMSVSELAARTGLAPATTHRLLRTLVVAGYVRQMPSRNYALGPMLVRLGEDAGRMLGSWARPVLAKLVRTTDETANFCLLDGDGVVYVAQVPSSHSMRMFTEVGRRVMVHCTGVGKAILSQMPEPEVMAMLSRTGMPAQTPTTKTDPVELMKELRQIREVGYAIDNGEQEIGVRCIAVPVLGGPARSAISVSGPAQRMQAADTAHIVELMQRLAGEVAAGFEAATP